MQEIKMVDLKTQYQNIKTEVDEAMQAVIDQTAFIKGQPVRDFACELAQYLDARHVIPCANGTDALQAAMMALGLKPGDEVITVGFTFISTVEVVALMGLKPVIVDVDPDDFMIRPDLIEQAITPQTKAIVPVHLFGQCADMEKILKIAREHDLYIVEDAAQALGATYTFSDGINKKAGTMGTIGCTSFFPSKNLGCFGDGGALFTQDDQLAEKLNAMVNHGMKQKYFHELVGMNSRLDTLQAAVLRVKLKYLDQYNQARLKAADYYDEALKAVEGVQTPCRRTDTTHIFHQYTLKLDQDRDQVKDRLKEKGIPAMVYYPYPLHLQKAFQYLGYQEGDLPVSEQLCHQVLSLPMHTELDEEQLEYITDHLSQILT